MKINAIHTGLMLSKVSKIFWIVILVVSLSVPQAKADSFKSIFKRQHENVSKEINLNNLSFEENLNYPIVLEKYSQKIVPFQKNIATKLARKNYSVEMMRNDEVVIITIPAEQLFIASDTTLIPKATKILEPLLPLFSNDGIYHIILAFHSDNTGSATYKENITHSRVNAIINWIEKRQINTANITPYPMSDFNPIYENTSVVNRRANRRLEIYLVPDKQMIELAKKNDLNNIILLK